MSSFWHFAEIHTAVLFIFLLIALTIICGTIVGVAQAIGHHPETKEIENDETQEL